MSNVSHTDETKLKKTKKHKNNTDEYKHLKLKRKPRLLHETQLSNNTFNYGNIMDRFLPMMNFKSPNSKRHNDYNNVNNFNNGSNVAYTDSTNMQFRPLIFLSSNIGASLNHPINSISESDNNSYNLNNETHNRLSNNRNANIASPNIDTSNSVASPTNLSELSNSVKSNMITHEKSIANALGYKSPKIFIFKPLKLNKRAKKLHDNLNQEMISLSNKTNKHLFIDTIINLPEIPFKVLDAPGLRNDYYSNLVCWANKSDRIAAGLGHIVYCWSEKNGTIPLQPFGRDIISALAFSSNDYLAVATKESKIFIYKPKSIFVITSYINKINSSICSIKWIPNSNCFFVGNDIGDVMLFELLKSDETTNDPKNKASMSTSYSLKLIVSFKCDQQQICGMDINSQGKQLAIGANNNCSTIWDISNLKKPKKMFHLKHEAAVKAVAFCPWMPNLLVTGGGSRDKHIRFWHSKSGTLISKHKTKGQITAVVWSRSKKELLVTFGFGEPHEKNIILGVYSYPTMKMKVKVNAPNDLRVLTADISNDFNSVCASISDQSVRIYSVWNSTLDLKYGNSEEGLFGSDIIDNEEGIDRSVETIR